MTLNSGLIKSKSYNEITTEKEIFYIFLCIAAGLILGSVIYIFADESTVKSTKELFSDFIENFSDSNPSKILSGLLSAHIPYYILILLFSTSVYGKPAIYIADIIKSSGIGFLAAYIHCNYALKGLEYCLLIFYPAKAIFIIFMLIASKGTLSYFNCIKQGRASITKKEIINSCVALSFLLLSAVVETILIISFSPLFSF